MRRWAHEPTQAVRNNASITKMMVALATGRPSQNGLDAKDPGGPASDFVDLKLFRPRRTTLFPNLFTLAMGRCIPPMFRLD